MKTLITILAFAFSGGIAAQSGTSGRMLYSDTAKEGLRHIVDSLNLDFSASENKAYKAPMQGRGDYFFIRGDETADALKDIRAGFSFKQMADKYPKAEMQPDILVVRTRQEIDSLKMTSFSVVSMGHLMPSVFFKDTAADPYQDAVTGWIFNYDSAENAINAFYFSKAMKAPELPERYARQLQYRDNLMPDSNRIYFDYAWECTPPYLYLPGPKMKAFAEGLNARLKRPLNDDSEEDQKNIDSVSPVGQRSTTFSRKLREWEEKRLAGVDSLMQHDAAFRKLFVDALDEARNHLTVTDEEFEEYAEIYASKEDALYFKRCRKVTSQYQEDSEPYYHRINIARLAAETLEWDAYIAAQVNVMCERFLFSADYEAAVTQRTFIKELEGINVNVADFFLGTLLKTDGIETSFGMAPYKLARVFAECLDKEYVGNAMLNMIADNELDGANRVMAYKILLSYIHFLEDAPLKEKMMRRVEEALAFLPEHLIITRPD